MWITENFKELKKICGRVSKLNNYDDLLQVCVEQFIKNKKVIDLPHKERLYFFTKIVRNNFYSKSSPYFRTYNFSHQEINNLELIDVPYQEPEANLEWVKKQLEELKNDQWYYVRLFELFIEEGANMTKLSRRTGIPLNSVSRDLKKIRAILIEKRKKL